MHNQFSRTCTINSKKRFASSTIAEQATTFQSLDEFKKEIKSYFDSKNPIDLSDYDLTVMGELSQAFELDLEGIARKLKEMPQDTTTSIPEQNRKTINDAKANADKLIDKSFEQEKGINLLFYLKPKEINCMHKSL